MKLNRKIKNKNQDNFLLYIPVIKHKNWENKNGLVYLIFYHNKPIEKFLRWLVKKPYVSDVELDKIGSVVWMIMDGKNSVYDISKAVREKFGEDEKSNNTRLIMYLRYLARKGWISFEKQNK